MEPGIGLKDLEGLFQLGIFMILPISLLCQSQTLSAHNLMLDQVKKKKIKQVDASFLLLWLQLTETQRITFTCEHESPAQKHGRNTDYIVNTYKASSPFCESFDG